jgi:hypothetical protein
MGLILLSKIAVKFQNLLKIEIIKDYKHASIRFVFALPRQIYASGI